MSLHFTDFLRDAPSNWGRWGGSDELGGLNLLGTEEVLRGVAEISRGQVFTLGTPIAGPEGEPMTPERSRAQRFMVQDRASYSCGRLQPLDGGLQWADDVVTMFLQGTTHVDALGHAWYGEQIWNGYPADETVDHLSTASIQPIAEKGIVGRAVLVDIARYKGKPRLDRAEAFTLADLLGAAEQQGTEIRPRDILLVRTGWLSAFYDEPEAFNEQPYHEPGLQFEPEVAEWFHRMEIPAWGTDTLANELQPQEQQGEQVMSVLHAALMRNLGVVFMEILWLEELAADCATDGRWSLFFASTPLKVVGGTGAPVNPMAMK